MFAAKQQSIEEFFIAGFPNYTLVFENMPSPTAEDVKEFLRLTVQYGTSFRMQIGGQGYRHPGIIMVQIMMKEGVGISRGVAIADEVKNLFLDVVHDNINFWVPYVTKMPVAERGWFQVQVTIPFYFDEVI